MADGEGDVQASGSFVARLATAYPIKTALHNLSARLRRIDVAEQIDAIYDTITPDPEQMASILLASIAGNIDLPEQRVKVEYLRSSERMKIPIGLGMSPTTPDLDITNRIHEWADRYLRAARLTYIQVRELIDHGRTQEQIREFLQTIAPATAADLQQAWRPLLENGQEDTAGNADVYYAVLSQALQMNFDIRDMGILLREDMRVPDIAWKDQLEATRNRLRNKLHPWTLQVIAAHNYVACSSSALGGWIRAYGIGCGIMPDAASRSIKEYTFTARMPTIEALKSITDYEKDYVGPAHLMVLCLNIIAMFGLFHLSTDHSYRTNDPKMYRIGTFYIDTLRTLTTKATRKYLLANKELILHTATHPFGVGQAYWLAQVMGRASLLTSPLQVRVDVTPPLVERVMIAHFTQRVWLNLPVGVSLNAVYREQIDILNRGVGDIKSNPPAFSAVFRLYGLDAQTPIPALLLGAVESLMPVVYGYAEAFHTLDDGRKDGVALALSLTDVPRDCKALADSWARMWRDYIDRMDDASLISFATKTLASQVQMGTKGLGT